MSDVATPAAPAAPAAGSTPAAPAAPNVSDSGGKGIAGIAAAASASVKAANQPSGKPTTAPVKAEPKPGAAPAAAKPGDAKPNGDDIDFEKFDFEKDEIKDRKVFNRKFREAYSASKSEVKSLKEQIQKLSQKPDTAANDAKMQQLESRLKTLTEDHQRLSSERGELHKRLTAIDFRNSEDYKSKYVAPYEQAYKNGVDFVTQLSVKEGEEERAATQADFDMLRKLPLGARIKQARQMFGDYGGDVLTFVREMENISSAANREADERAANWDKEQAEIRAKQEQEGAQYDELHRSALDGIKTHEEFGKWVSESADDPEFTKVLTEAKGDFEQLKTDLQGGKLTPQERAARVAMLESHAIGFRPAIYQVQVLEKKLADAMAELEKLRGADPGAQPKRGDGAPAEQPIGGIAGAAMAFKRA